MAKASLIALLALGSSGWISAVQPERADKSSFHLFHPTPRELMRPINTDRPDATESPRTVDAGHFQIEADILRYGYDRHNPERADRRVETVEIAPLNLRIGVRSDLELQLIVEPYRSIRTRDRSTGEVGTQRGFGDVYLRAKQNLWGNDQGTTALGLLPWIKFPTSQDSVGNNAVEGGVLIPFAADLPAEWELGLMTGVELLRDEQGSGHHPEFINTLALGHPIAGPLSGFIEFASQVSTERGSDWVGTVNMGFAYALSPDIQLDAGVNLGVTRAAEDVTPFFGLAWRF
jgi:hypothetical protein